MKKITIAYWHSPINGIKYKHLQEMQYTDLYDSKINEILSECISNELSVMIRPVDGGIIIWIDKFRFGQK